MDHELENFLLHRIVFEGVSLPKAALLLDHLGMYDNLPGVSEETSEWCWRFTICVGRIRSDSSGNIIHRATELLDLCRRCEHHLCGNFAKHFMGEAEPQFYDEWIRTLETMIKIARDRDMCEWIAPLLPGDRHYGKTWSEISAGTLERIEGNVARSHGEKQQFWKRILEIVRQAMQK